MTPLPSRYGLGLYAGPAESGYRARPFVARPVTLSGDSDVDCCSFSSRIPGVVDSISEIFRPAALPGLETIEVTDD